MTASRMAAFALAAPLVMAACAVVQRESAPSGSGGTVPGSRGNGLGGAAASLNSAVETTAAANTSQTNQPPNNPYFHLCGGSKSVCLPDPASEACTPGGDPRLNGNSDGGPSPALRDGGGLSCQLTPTDGGVQAICAMSGGAAAGEACGGDDAGSIRCGSGLACVTANLPDAGGDAGGGSAVCRPYCCGDPENCPDGTFCVPRLMAQADISVPVCAPAVACELLNDSASCVAGETCTIVRASGTTSCVRPGVNTEGQSCPSCAAGLTCWNSTTCRRLCHTNPPPWDCGPSGICQGGVWPYPADAGIGYCVYY